MGRNFFSIFEASENGLEFLAWKRKPNYYMLFINLFTKWLLYIITTGENQNEKIIIWKDWG